MGDYLEKMRYVHELGVFFYQSAVVAFYNRFSFLFNLQFTFFVFVFSGSESCGIIGMRGRQTCLMCAHVFALCDICVCMGPAMRFAPTYASHQKRALHRLYFSVFCFILSYLIT